MSKGNREFVFEDQDGDALVVEYYYGGIYLNTADPSGDGSTVAFESVEELDRLIETLQELRKEMVTQKG